MDGRKGGDIRKKPAPRTHRHSCGEGRAKDGSEERKKAGKQSVGGEGN